MSPEKLIEGIPLGQMRALAKGITEVENRAETGRKLLLQLKPSRMVPVIGFTGPPGAGKSTLIQAFTQLLLQKNYKVGIIAVDPTSPFTGGSVLGDRVRMSSHFLNPNVYIRSLATRGALGGLSSRAFEVAHLMQCAGFDYIFIETVGVGQSEVEIAGLADTTVLVLVPEAGDEVQTLKSGIMEIADVYVVNKSDREGAAAFVKNLHMLLHERPASAWNPEVVQTIASKGEGMEQLWEAIQKHQTSGEASQKKLYMLLQKTLAIIKEERTRDIEPKEIWLALQKEISGRDFNLFSFAQKYI